jgi:TolA-binding protein
MERQEWHAAMDRLEQFLKNPPESQVGEAHFWLGFCLIKCGEFPGAVKAFLPFEAELKDDTWADDALLHLGQAHRGSGELERAAEAWNRLLEEYPQSVWHNEALVKLSELYFYTAGDYQACLPVCERLVREVSNLAATAEARYLAVYCLNELRRFDEARKWLDEQFDAGDPIDESRRRLLLLHQELLEGNVQSALTGISALPAEFPDFDRSSRLDFLVRVSYLLRNHGQAERARSLLRRYIAHRGGLNEAWINYLLDELEATFAGDEPQSYRAELSSLVDDAETSPLVKIVVSERLALRVAEAGQVDDALSVLSRQLAADSSEFNQVRCTVSSAEILARHRGAVEEAHARLAALLPQLTRRDLTQRVRREMERLQVSRDSAHPGP